MVRVTVSVMDWVRVMLVLGIQSGIPVYYEIIGQYRAAKLFQLGM